MKRKTKIWMGAVSLMLVAVMAVLAFWPATDGRCRRGVGEAVAFSCYAVPVPGGDTLYFTGLRGDSLEGLASSPGAARRDFRSNAFFISFSGRLLTAADTLPCPSRLPGGDWLPALRREAGRLDRRLADCRHMLGEMDYYGRTHSVADEGFHEVMAHREWMKARCGELERCRRMVDALCATGGADAVLLRRLAVRLPADTAGREWGEVPCRMLSQGGGVAVWQAEGGCLPEGVRRFRLNPFPYTWFHWLRPAYTWWGHWGRHGRELRPAEDRVSAVRVRMAGGRPEVPLVDGAEGAPVTGPWGCLNGMWAGGRFHSAPSLYVRSLAHSSWPVCFWEDLREWARGWRTWFRRGGTGGGEAGPETLAYGRSLREDGAYYGQLSGGRPEGEGVMRYAGGGVYRGRWHGGRRDGYGEHVDSAGRVYAGYWRADSLRRGVARDRRGVYVGFFNRALQEQGEGEYAAADGGYYVGKWKEGRRDGFGFALSPREVVKCGVWSKGRFKGEQMLYHSERVYGIDISKYQHIHRGRRYGIDWKRLRITHLGHHISEKRVQGEVDYPVSFVYVKCTEGQTVRNPYYERDMRDARRRGFPVGAYHFFSTRPAAGQAAFFLKRARLRKGDLPPMLDMELTDRKVASMGGREVLFREMLVWLRTVGERTGTTPVLYVNQNFVNRHLPFAPEELKAYPVWVARYGEYKPYVHLLYWQLSPYGTVEGIRGRVDINVFNGSEEMFREYVRTHGVQAGGR